jgi:Aminotransferase class-III
MNSVATDIDVTTGAGMVDACRRHSLFEWSAQSHVDPIHVAHAKGVYFWMPEGKRFIDFNSQLMCVNIGHGDERVIRAVPDQVAPLAYVNPFLGSEARARLSLKLAELCPGDIDTFNSHPLGCAAALATIAVSEEDRLIERAKERGALMTSLLQEVAAVIPRSERSVRLVCSASSNWYGTGRRSSRWRRSMVRHRRCRRWRDRFANGDCTRSCAGTRSSQIRRSASRNPSCAKALR